MARRESSGVRYRQCSRDDSRFVPPPNYDQRAWRMVHGARWTARWGSVLEVQNLFQLLRELLKDAGGQECFAVQ